MQRRKMMLVFVLWALAFAAAPAHADDNSRRADSRVVLVVDGAGHYEVATHRDFVTTLVLPDEIVTLAAPGKRNFQVDRLAESVGIRPSKRAKPGATSNVMIQTGTMRLSVVVRVVDESGDADPQVVFQHAAGEREIQRRIDAAVKQRLAEREAAFRERVEAAIAVRAFQRSQCRRGRRAERNGDHIIVRNTKSCIIGGYAYLSFRIENRSGKDYKLARVRVKANGRNVAGTVVWEGKKVAGPLLGVVPPRASRDGLVVVRRADKLKRPLTLVVSEDRSKRPVSVGGIELR